MLYAHGHGCGGYAVEHSTKLHTINHVQPRYETATSSTPLTLSLTAVPDDNGPLNIRSKSVSARYVLRPLEDNACQCPVLVSSAYPSVACFVTTVVSFGAGSTVFCCCCSVMSTVTAVIHQLHETASKRLQSATPKMDLLLSILIARRSI